MQEVNDTIANDVLAHAVQVIAVRPVAGGMEVRVIDIDDLPVNAPNFWALLFDYLGGPKLLIPVRVRTDVRTVVPLIQRNALAELPGVLCYLHPHDPAERAL